MKFVPQINPVTLKELRQLVRSRLIIWGMVALPAITLLITILVLISEMEGLSTVEATYGKGLGEGPLFAVSIILGIVTCGAIPIFAAIKTILETGKGATGLEYTTTLTPTKIVSGKITAVAAISGIATALSMPFFVLSYLMRGIDLSTAIFMPCVLFVAGIAAFSFLLLPACAKRPVALRIVAVLATYAIVPVLLGVISEVMRIGGGSGGVIVGPIFLGIAFLVVAFIVYCRAQAAAELAPPHIDTTRPLRFTQAVLFAISVFFAFSFFEVWAPVLSCIAMMILLRAAFYPTPLTRGAILHAPRSKFMRLLAFPFATGSVPSMLFALLMLAVVIAVSAVKADTPRHFETLLVILFEFGGLLVIAGSIGRMLVSSHPRLGSAVGKIALGYIVTVNVFTVLTEFDVFERKDFQWMICNLDGIDHQLTIHFGGAFATAAVAFMFLLLATALEFGKFRKP